MHRSWHASFYKFIFTELFAFRFISTKHQNFYCNDKCAMLSLTDLIDPSVDFNEPTDIFAIGFEEIVDLNASNIMSAR